MRLLFPIAAFLLSAGPGAMADSAPPCAPVFRQVAENNEEPPVERSILEEIKGSYFDLLNQSDPEAIKKWNIHEVKELSALPVDQRLPNRMVALNPQQRQEIMDWLLTNEVTNIENTAYDAVPGHPDDVWGYCFARAAAVHIRAENAGVDKTQIRKIWAVGALNTDRKPWHFHVATILRGTDGRWYAFDPKTARTPVAVEDWVQAMYARNKEWLEEMRQQTPRWQKSMAPDVPQWMREMNGGSNSGKVMIITSHAKRLWAYEDTTYNVRYTPQGAVKRGTEQKPDIFDPKFHGYWLDLLKSIREQARSVAEKARAAATAARLAPPPPSP